MIILLWINPFNVLYRSARYGIFKVLLNIIISPFGLVNFKYFFLADIITSLGVPLKDFVILVIAVGTWDLNVNAKNYVLLFFIVDILPFWFRAW